MSENFCIRLPKELMNILRGIAKEENRSVNYIIKELILKGLGNRG